MEYAAFRKGLVFAALGELCEKGRKEATDALKSLIHLLKAGSTLVMKCIVGWNFWDGF